MHGCILSKNEQITQALMDVVLFMALPEPSGGGNIFQRCSELNLLNFCTFEVVFARFSETYIKAFFV